MKEFENACLSKKSSFLSQCFNYLDFVSVLLETYGLCGAGSPSSGCISQLTSPFPPPTKVKIGWGHRLTKAIVLLLIPWEVLPLAV